MSEELRARTGGGSSGVVELEARIELEPGRGFEGLVRSLRRWWRRESTRRLEDELVDHSGGRAISRFVPPVVLPILVLPTILVLREPENTLAAVTLAAGAIALLYSYVGGALDRSALRPFWVALANAAVYTAIISVLLWAFITVEHPRQHLHWVVFFFYFLMIGANGLAADPWHPITAGGVAIARRRAAQARFCPQAAPRQGVSGRRDRLSW